MCPPSAMFYKIITSRFGMPAIVSKLDVLAEVFFSGLTINDGILWLIY